MSYEFFQLGPLPTDQLTGTYNIYLVSLSFFVATAASYVALDITGRLREVGNSTLSGILWVLGGALAMGAGIWSMHFIGMLAFTLDMPMTYDTKETVLSMIVAVIASGFALGLLKTRVIKLPIFILGGVILGLAIASMHYIGMSAMETNMSIHYIPSIFILSILVAIAASEAALWLAIQSTKGTLKKRINLKLVSSIVMGAAICGMHYTGMAAAIFTPKADMVHAVGNLGPEILSAIISMVTLFILGVAFTVSAYKELSNAQALSIARQTGMAEVASNVLHNVGNVLNSVNVSATLVIEKINESEIAGIVDASNLINQHKDDLGTFITNDPKGSKLPAYLNLLGECWKKDKEQVLTEMKILMKNIDHIKSVISMQQKLSGAFNFEECVSIETVLEEALLIVGADFSRHNIILKRNYHKLHAVYVNKTKLIQIIVNLIANAKDALVASKQEQKLITLEAGSDDPEYFYIRVTDNGHGISSGNLAKIFTRGFSTKTEGHGYGLHSSSLAAIEMDGALTVASPGEGLGASFTLELPYKNETVEVGNAKQ